MNPEDAAVDWEDLLTPKEGEQCSTELACLEWATHVAAYTGPDLSPKRALACDDHWARLQQMIGAAAATAPPGMITETRLR